MYFMINRKTLDIAMAVLFITGVICAVVFGLIPSALDGEAPDDSVEPAVMNENGRPPDKSILLSTRDMAAQIPVR